MGTRCVRCGGVAKGFPMYAVSRMKDESVCSMCGNGHIEETDLPYAQKHTRVHADDSYVKLCKKDDVIGALLDALYTECGDYGEETEL
jgi:hypothetical protein